MISIHAGFTSNAGVDHELDFTIFDIIHRVRSPLAYLQNGFRSHAVCAQMGCRPPGGQDLEALFLKGAGDGNYFILMRVVDADKNLPGAGQRKSGRHLRLGKGEAEGMVYTHHLARGFHFRPQQDIYIGKAVKGENRFFHGDMRRLRGDSKTQFRKRSSQHHLGGQLGQRDTDRLAHEGNGAGGPGIHLQDIQNAVLHGILNIHEAHHVQFPGNHLSLNSNGIEKFP